MGDHNSGRESDTGELLRQRRERTASRQIVVSSICVAGDERTLFAHGISLANLRVSNKN